MNCSPSPAAEQDEERWREVDEERLRELKKKKKGLNCDMADSGQKERERKREVIACSAVNRDMPPLLLSS